MVATIQQAFRTSAIAEDVIALPSLPENDDRTLVNYIWINKDKALTDFDNPACAVELANIKLALANANKYPEADFNIWVDKKLLDDYSLLTLNSFIDDFAKHGNVRLRDLQEIPGYANDALFKPIDSTKKGYLSASFDRASMGSIYSRADYARILMLDHCVETESYHSNIIYSDIDCPDIRLADVLPILKRYGIAVNDTGKCISNGFIGVAADKDDMKEQLEILKARTGHAAHTGELGYRIFRDFLEEIGMPYETWHSKIGLHRLLPKMLTAPEPLFYKLPAAKLNAWKSAHGLKPE